MAIYRLMELNAAAVSGALLPIVQKDGCRQ